MDSISNLLTEYRLESKENILNYFKCFKCKKTLKSDNQLACGCRICNKCVIDLVKSDHKFCPGLTDLCKETSLSDFKINCEMSRNISNAIVKCPLHCSHEVKLMNMEGHLKVCFRTKMENCEFFKNRNQVIENMINENDELKHKIESIYTDVTDLKENIKLRDYKIESINTEMMDLKRDLILKDKKIQHLTNNYTLIKRTSLSNVHIDYDITRNISNTIVKCPLHSSHEVKLMNISHHLPACLNNSIKRFPCCEGINQEMQEMRNENEKLKYKIESISNDMRNVMEINTTRNEKMESMNVEMLKLKQNMMQHDGLIQNMIIKLPHIFGEIPKLVQHLLSTDNQISYLNEEITSLKLDSKRKDDKINVQQKIIKSIETEKLLKEKIETIEREMKNLKNYVNVKNEELKSNVLSMKTDMSDLQHDMKLIDDKHCGELKLIQASGRIVWTIDCIGERQKNKEVVHSAYFYGKNQPYKMSLWVDTDNRMKGRTCLAVYLCVWQDQRNGDMKWPFRKTVMVNIRNKMAKINDTQVIQLFQPEDNSYNYSGGFIFYYSELRDAGLLVNDCINIECNVD